MTATDWPVELRGVTETVVTTLGPNDAWNVAALGVHAPTTTAPATAQTWGKTRTRRNFAGRGGGYVQFTRDPVLFVDAALGVREQSDPTLDSADAWVEITVERRATGTDEGTEWVEWGLSPVDASVRRERVPTFNRGYAAVVEATVAASRLDVDAFETETLRERIDYFDSVVERCGGPAERRAFERLRSYAAGEEPEGDDA